ncbi:MAG: FkbM family methyltransferase [Candidatus Velamenicoccus archaeovorus]
MKHLAQSLNELFDVASRPRSPANAVDVLKNKRLVVYGAGNGYIAFRRSVLDRLALKPEVILDQKFMSGDMFDGIKAMSLEDYRPTEKEAAEAVVVVTVGDEAIYDKIARRLQEIGFSHVMRASAIYEFNIHHLSAEMENQGSDFYVRHRQEIEAVMGLWHDVLSREVYLGVLRTYMTRCPVSIAHRPFQEQYFPEDIALAKGYTRFIHCGAYDGDTVRQLQARHGKIQALACFEPDLRNFALLRDYLRDNHGKIADDVLAFPCGVFNDDVQVSFAADRHLCSSVFDEGAAFIQCVALDHVLPDFMPTFISMDVEGAESEALAGARQLILRNAPDLAISVYHFPHHLWDIPLLLNSLGLGYRFYLRNYTGFTYETILYASVPGRMAEGS